MNRFSLLLLFTLPALVVGTGCFGPKKPKPNPAIAADVEESFKQRWVAKRISELSATGEAPDGRKAREQALKEFAEKYEYTSAAKGYGKP